MLTGRSAIAAGAGAAAWYLHPEFAPWPPFGAVPILDLIELRNPGAYLLFRAWWWLAPLATGSVLTASALSAWAVWGPGSRTKRAPRGALRRRLGRDLRDGRGSSPPDGPGRVAFPAMAVDPRPGPLHRHLHRRRGGIGQDLRLHAPLRQAAARLADRRQRTPRRGPRARRQGPLLLRGPGDAGGGRPRGGLPRAEPARGVGPGTRSTSRRSIPTRWPSASARCSTSSSARAGSRSGSRPTPAWCALPSSCTGSRSGPGSPCRTSTASPSPATSNCSRGSRRRARASLPGGPAARAQRSPSSGPASRPPTWPRTWQPWSAGSGPPLPAGATRRRPRRVTSPRSKRPWGAARNGSCRHRWRWARGRTPRIRRNSASAGCVSRRWTGGSARTGRSSTPRYGPRSWRASRRSYPCSTSRRSRTLSVPQGPERIRREGGGCCRRWRNWSNPGR